ncbi:type-4 ice-structuring protein-like [Menidia menidia]|uniref:(Atlantic silverside) hypothetical protein n=1 Tax=Menidia menidia TaxID=238744 RepID=A0A8S4AQ39_9TELE|nr:unnamed protein product [Menidia menidia]
MKFFLLAAVALLALAHGSVAQDAADLQKLSQYLDEMKAKVAQDLGQILGNPDLAGQAQTFLEENKKKLEPLAAQVQEQLKSATSNMDETLRPLAEQMQAQVQPMIEDFQKQMEGIFQKLTQQAKAIGQ